MAALYQYLSGDHERLDALLAASLRDDGTIDAESYGELRRGLLRHIAIEEKILLPEMRRRRGGSIIEEQIHLDHAALASLLVPPPTRTEIETIRSILAMHNPLEESEGGLYETFEALTRDELDQMMERVRAIPQIPLSPEADTPVVRRSIAENLRLAAESRARLGSS
jgi:hypothetical protein